MIPVGCHYSIKQISPVEQAARMRLLQNIEATKDPTKWQQTSKGGLQMLSNYQHN
jgi:hypothetical protein